MQLEERPKLVACNGWLGFMTIWCTPMVRCGKWTTQYRRPNSRDTKIGIDQWKNEVVVEQGQDVLAALAMAYVFDVCQRQPFVTLMGKQDPEYDDAPEDLSIGSDEDDWDDSPKREARPLTGEDESTTDNPERFEDDGLDAPSTGEGEEGEPKPKKKKKKKRPPSKYPPADPDEDAFADCLE